MSNIFEEGDAVEFINLFVSNSPCTGIVGAKYNSGYFIQTDNHPFRWEWDNRLSNKPYLINKECYWVYPHSIRKVNRTTKLGNII